MRSWRRGSPSSTRAHPRAPTRRARSTSAPGITNLVVAVSVASAVHARHQPRLRGAGPGRSWPTAASAARGRRCCASPSASPASDRCRRPTYEATTLRCTRCSTSTCEAFADEIRRSDRLLLAPAGRADRDASADQRRGCAHAQHLRLPVAGALHLACALGNPLQYRRREQDQDSAAGARGHVAASRDRGRPGPRRRGVGSHEAHQPAATRSNASRRRASEGSCGRSSSWSPSSSCSGSSTCGEQRGQRQAGRARADPRADRRGAGQDRRARSLRGAPGHAHVHDRDRQGHLRRPRAVVDDPRRRSAW